jgi:hypothetical protein
MNATTFNWSGSQVGRPTTDTLTDRYVWAVLKSLPEAKRLDIDRELRASIADDVDARVESGDKPAAAERAVLLALGEPARLAASYLGRTLGLIGPELYPAYTALLKLLYIIVLPIATGGYFIAQLIVGTDWGGLMGGTIGILLSLVVHLGFWTTLIFAIAERGDTRMKRIPGVGDEPFDPAQLPSITTPTTGASRGDLIGTLVALVLVPLGLVGQQLVPLGDAARPLPVLDPTLWSFWLPYLIVIVVLAAGFAVLLYRVGRWTWPLVALNAILGAAVTIPFVVLLRGGELVNPEFLEAFGWERVFAVGGVATIALSVVAVGILLWSIGDSIWKTIQAGRAARLS